MSQNDRALWNGLAAQARSGDLYLDDERAAYECAKACDKHLRDLADLLSDLRKVQNVSGFGQFTMADDLRRKFLEQATGQDHSIDAVVREHIEVVKSMREVFALSFKRLTGQEVENVSSVTQVGQGLDR